MEVSKADQMAAESDRVLAQIDAEMESFVSKDPPVLDTALPDDLAKLIQKYVYVPDYTAKLLAIWVIHTWLIAASHCTPYLYISSAGPGAGKTRLLDVLNLLVRSPRRAEGMTPTVMFKLISQEQSTMLIDEVDNVFAGARYAALQIVINTGYKTGGEAYREKGGEVIRYTTYSAKVFSGIRNGFMPKPVLDRCIPIDMEKRPDDVELARFSEYYVSKSPEVQSILDRIFAFREDFYADVSARLPEPLIGLSDRQNEISESLLAIASVMGCELELSNILRSIFKEAGGQKTEIQVIMERIKDAFGEETQIFSEDLCEALGKSWDPIKLGQWLKSPTLLPYGIKSKSIRDGLDVRRGFDTDQFAKAWRVYLGITPLELVEDQEEEAA